MRVLFSRRLAVLVALLAMLSIARAADGQPYPLDVRQQGYYQAADTAHFVFDATLYGAAPHRVVVTGAFRGWSQDMDDPAWALEASRVDPHVWELAVPNARGRTIRPGMPFKFRIDDGLWLDPPATAPNDEGGNLVFLHNVRPPRLYAELRGPRAIWAELTGEHVVRPLVPDAYRLERWDGHRVPLADVVPNTGTGTLLVPAEDLDTGAVHYLSAPTGLADGDSLRSIVRFDGLWRTLYSTKPLGAEIEQHDGRTVTAFRAFAPRAHGLVLYLYHGKDDTPGTGAYAERPMRRDADGVWEHVEEGDLHGTYYDLRVYGPGGPGSEFYEQAQVNISDPYARVSDDSFGKSRVWRRLDAPRPVRGGRPKLEEMVAYEVHVQDFTDNLPLPAHERGTFVGMGRTGLTNARGEPIGFDYLTHLGINTVHLMPVQEFLHYPDAEWQATFADDPWAEQQGIDREYYEWGYRTTHAFAIESRFRMKGGEPGEERAQFRALVEQFHDAGLAVVVDLVPNHTGENMDGRFYHFHWNALDKLYYYRTDEEGRHIGPFGNEVKTEERPMVQRWLIDQCKALMDEFGLDGFRIDLAGQIDKQSLRALKAALPEDALVYGEPWIPPSDPEVVRNPDWAWYKLDAPITFFQDETRTAFKGPVSNPEDKRTDRGFAGGDPAMRPRVMLGLANRFPDEPTPNLSLTYLDIHDNWALADQFATTGWDGRRGVDEGPFKIAATLMFTALGPLVIHGGTEIMRSKGLSPLEEKIIPTASGLIYFHGKRDTYNLRAANRYEWETVGARPGEVDGPDGKRPNDYAGMLAYWQGLMALRASEAGAVFRVGEPVPEGYYRFLTPANPHLLGYTVADRVLVLINTDERAASFTNVPLPEGTWRLVANAEQVALSGLPGADATLTGGTTPTLRVPAQSVKIWVVSHSDIQLRLGRPGCYIVRCK